MEERKEINRLRDEVTRVKDQTKKRKLYKKIYSLAREAGYYERMIEVSTFAAIKPSHDDLKTCRMAALAVGDRVSFVRCCKAVKYQPSIGEIRQLIPRGQEYQDCTVDFLLDLIKKNVRQNQLTDVQWLILQLPTSDGEE